MTTAQFIAQTYGTKNDKYGKYGYERRCSSVMTDKDGIVYSYGYHYPLAFHVAGLDFVNTQGYSSTTAKHIAWAKQAIGYDKYIGVKLWAEDARVLTFFASENDKLKAIRTALRRELDSIREEMATKKRHDTWVYKDLENQEVRVIQAFNRVDNRIG